MKNKSFTLIELLVVIVIIGILAGVIMISTSSSIGKANFAKAQTFSNTVQEELLLNLISEWTFDEGDAKDSWGASDGITTGHAPNILTSDNCVSGKCMNFNSSESDYIDCGTSTTLNPRDNITISVWIKRVDESIAQMPIVSRWGPAAGDLSYMIDIYQNQIRGLAYQMVGVNRTRYSTTLIGKDKWYFLVFKFNGDEPYLYINGVMEGTLGGSKATYLQQSSTGLNLIGKKGDSATVFLMVQ